MADRYIQQEDSDIAIQMPPVDDGAPIATFDGIEDEKPTTKPASPIWKSMSYNPKDWYTGAVEEARNFTWEITEPNHVVRLSFSPQTFSNNLF